MTQMHENMDRSQVKKNAQMAGRPHFPMACIIVTYNPDLGRLAALLAQLKNSQVSVYVVDNRFSAECSWRVLNLCGNAERVRVLCLPANEGIASAINIGIAKACADNHRFALLLDQDSVPQEGLIEELQAAAERLATPEHQVAALAPRLYDPRSRTFFRFASLKWGLWKKIGCQCGDGSLVRSEFLNSSGSLLFLDHWERIGPFNEDFFIDHVETEWYMKVRRLGLQCFGYCSKSYLEHHMGDNVSRYWLFGWRFMPRRPPWRHYTIIRNAIWMWKMEHVPYSWIGNSALKIVFTLFYFSLFDKEAKSQLLYILRGIWDGLFIRPQAFVFPSNVPYSVHKKMHSL